MSREAVSLTDLGDMTLAWTEGRAWYQTHEYARISMPSVVRLPDQCDRAWRGARKPEWKVVAQENGERWLAFDLVRDPAERENLARDPRSASWWRTLQTTPPL